MDDKRFDLLTKSLSSGVSRRNVLRALAALGTAALGAQRAGAEPGNGKGPKKCYGAGSQCTNAKQCCSEICTNRQCAPETPPDPCAGLNCEDGNPCTTDSCSGGACAHSALPDGTGCGTGFVCVTGTCVPLATTTTAPDPCAGVNCDDGNSCTTDTCSFGSCSHTALPVGTPCPGGFCDATGSCVPGVCAPGANQSCYTGPAGTQGVGACRAGTQTCDAAGQWGPCLGEVTPVAEVCGDGIDNDCDGVADDGCQTTTTTIVPPCIEDTQPCFFVDDCCSGCCIARDFEAFCEPAEHCLPPTTTTTTPRPCSPVCAQGQRCCDGTCVTGECCTPEDCDPIPGACGTICLLGQCGPVLCVGAQVCCDGTCAECCESDVSNCSNFGTDPQCAICQGGVCDSGPQNVPCMIGSDEFTGYCDSGVCALCRPVNSTCTHPAQCCSQACDFFAGFCISL
jgi:hypothetical protein